MPESVRWLEPLDVNEALSRVQALILSEGDAYMGWYADYEAEKVTVVIAPPANRAERDARRQAVAQAVRGAVRVRVQPSCRVAAEIADIRASLRGQAWNVAGKGLPAAWHFEASDSRVHVLLPLDATAEESEIKRQFGDAVAVERREMATRSGRLDDVSPHYGGARIRTPTQYCTSGFVVSTSTGKWATTAGHCVTGNGVNVANNGTGNYGTTAGYRFPDPDLTRIGSSTETYTNRIYTDPGSPTSRTVTGKMTSPPASYCLSGSFSGSVCGLSLKNGDAEFCDAAGCTYHLAYVEHPDRSIIACQGGDSGGPAYGRTGDTTADARGLIVACASGGSYFAYLHNIGTVETGLGAKIVTTCCASKSY